MSRWQRSPSVLLTGACLFLFLASPGRAAEVDPYLPDDSEIVLTVNVRQMLDSPLIKKHALETMKAALKANPEVQKVLAATGFDPFTDLATICYGGPGDGSEKGLVIFRGKFAPAKILASAEDDVKKGKSVKLHRLGAYTIHESIFEVKGDAPAKASMFSAMLDKEVIVASSDKNYVIGALDKHAGKKKPALNKEMRNLLEKADAGSSIWLAALNSSLDKSALAQDEKAKEVLDKFTSFVVGLTINNDVKLEARVAAKNADAAGELEKELANGLEQAKGLATLFAEKQPEFVPLLKLLDSAKISTQGNTVTLKGNVSEEVIEKALKKE